MEKLETLISQIRAKAESLETDQSPLPQQEVSAFLRQVADELVEEEHRFSRLLEDKQQRIADAMEIADSFKKTLNHVLDTMLFVKERRQRQ